MFAYQRLSGCFLELANPQKGSHFLGPKDPQMPKQQELQKIRNMVKILRSQLGFIP